MQAPKNGFFYVLDRETGELISAEHVRAGQLGDRRRHGDRPAGRDIPTRAIRDGQAVRGHARPARRAQLAPDGVQPRHGPRLHPGERASASTYIHEPRLSDRADGLRTPASTARRGCRRAHRGRASASVGASRAHLIAWDPVTQREVWRVEHPGPWQRRRAGDGRQSGLPGHVDGRLRRLSRRHRREAVVDAGADRRDRRADDLRGRRRAIHRGDGRQGRRASGCRTGAASLKSGAGAQHQPRAGVQARRNGNAARRRPPLARAIDPPPLTATAAVVADGIPSVCGELQRVPRRRLRSPAASCPICARRHISADDGYFDIVLNGTLKERGMVSFAPMINREQAAAIRSYVISQAHDTKTLRSAGP